MEYDSLGSRIAKTVVPSKFTKWYKTKEALGDLRDEGKAGDSIFEEDMFDVDTEEFRSTERRKLTRRSKVSLFILLVLIPVTILACVFWVDKQGGFITWLDRIFVWNIESFGNIANKKTDLVSVWIFCDRIYIRRYHESGILCDECL